MRYTHDAAGNVTDIAWPDGFHVATTYDSYRRPVQLLENGATSLAKYSYDTLNRRTQVELGNGTRTELAYDAQGGLATLNHRFTSSTEDWLSSFTRNQLGEIRQAGVTNSRYAWTPAAASTAYTANALNQYTAAAGKGVTHDANGNLTGDGVWTYAYDLDNRLRTASGAGTNATLAYDPEGRLVRTTVNGVDTTLLYDGQNLAAEYDGAGTLTRRYVFGPGVDAPLVQYEGAGTNARNWVYANQQGSVVALANGNGVTTGGQGYGPFGETSGTLASRFGYTGQQNLAPLGLYYYKARMYSPTLGRFLQTDPVGYSDDLNWYAYVGNNPVNFSDPTGLAGCSSSNLAQTVEKWWNASVAGFKSEGVTEAASRVLDGLPVEAAAVGAIGAIKGIGTAANEARAVSGPVFKTTKEATAAAEALGFKRISETVNGQAIYQDGKRFITRDVDGHNGGAWKMADSVQNLGSKNTRLGTFDASLTNLIGK
ncbi:RHS repeat-associated core domain-containing protein [Paraburkholderia rhizosphaerae]|uniref:RHS repeat-associated protein n=1 Tax=Paraburkholderia rhizosphaerae TaxID=480658 RepID=A0A4R8KNM7_9BURK|nr:RHS repeat-associated core domain-containing protein [Paraburkholderia rhizosphaerae]TDY31212.1 RHS repeat-associated protein [Paraburkholderia rhizosphaerae]